jgi:hypothetical protein
MFAGLAGGIAGIVVGAILVWFVMLPVLNYFLTPGIRGHVTFRAFWIELALLQGMKKAETEPVVSHDDAPYAFMLADDDYNDPRTCSVGDCWAPTGYVCPLHRSPYNRPHGDYVDLF